MARAFSPSTVAGGTKGPTGVRGESSEFHRCFGKAVRKVAADLAAFIRVARESRPDLDAVRTRAADAEWDPVGGTNEEWTNVRTKLLFDLAEEALEAYEHELSATNTIDYADMCAKAAERLSEEPERASRWGHILVDEFQDITKTRADLIEALLESYDGDATLFAVGDDWQSIYAFAGADVSIMTRFADHFGRRLANTNGTTPASYANVVPLDRTFRFPQNIADVSGRFVMSNRNQLTKTVNARRLRHATKWLMELSCCVIQHRPEMTPTRRAAQHLGRFAGSFVTLTALNTTVTRP